ncbi:hypothetical protein BC831DRAFT_472304 [Entophlyctis helioformis]|nr:hypothetical protein BC831DRAFT_472304 [Entophlyctis helioformis]
MSSERERQQQRQPLLQAQPPGMAPMSTASAASAQSSTESIGPVLVDPPEGRSWACCRNGASCSCTDCCACLCCGLPAGCWPCFCRPATSPSAGLPTLHGAADGASVSVSASAHASTTTPAAACCFCFACPWLRPRVQPTFDYDEIDDLEFETLLNSPGASGAFYARTAAASSTLAAVGPGSGSGSASAFGPGVLGTLASGGGGGQASYYPFGPSSRRQSAHDPSGALGAGNNNNNNRSHPRLANPSAVFWDNLASLFRLRPNSGLGVLPGRHHGNGMSPPASFSRGGYVPVSTSLPPSALQSMLRSPAFPTQGSMSGLYGATAVGGAGGPAYGGTYPAFQYDDDEDDDDDLFGPTEADAQLMTDEQISRLTAAASNVRHIGGGGSGLGGGERLRTASGTLVMGSGRNDGAMGTAPAPFVLPSAGSEAVQPMQPVQPSTAEAETLAESAAASGGRPAAVLNDPLNAMQAEPPSIATHAHSTTARDSRTRLTSSSSGLLAQLDQDTLQQTQQTNQSQQGRDGSIRSSRSKQPSPEPQSDDDTQRFDADLLRRLKAASSTSSTHLDP